MPTVNEMANLVRSFTRFERDLIRWAERRMDPVLRSQTGAEDIVQTAFLEVQQRFQRAPEEMDIENRGWWIGVVRKSLFRLYRDQRRLKRDVRRDVPLPSHSSALLSERLLRQQTTPSGEVRHRELLRQVRDALDRLRPEDQEIVWMRYFEGLSPAEIAAVLGCQLNTAVKRYGRALERLREILKDASISLG